MLMPPVSRYMTTDPITIPRTATLADARRLMRTYGVRHLPVMEGDELCGIVSDRDLLLLERFENATPHVLLVADAMASPAFSVDRATPLDVVVSVMAEHKYGSVIVVGSQGVEGVFTGVDACNALAQVLQRATA